jgi:hypothetical protein
MKRVYVLTILLVLVILCSGCFKDNDKPSGSKGLVSFKQNPVYTPGKIAFTAQIQFGEGGKTVDIEYKLYDGSTELASGMALADSNPDGFGLFYATPAIEIAINGNALNGKTLTVYLDPDNKVTLPEYTTETYVNLYKKASVLIP